MGPYLPTSVEADSMQTLYLMNPGYTGYTDATSNASQMDLITPPSSADNSSNRIPMQNFNGFLFPPSLTQVSHLPNIPNGQQQQEQVPSAVLYEGGINKQGYTNTDSWIASARNNVSLNADRPSLVNNRGQHSTSDSSQYSFRQNPSLVSNGVSLSFNMETSQGLSLSLSPQKNPLMHNHQQSFQISEPEVDMSNANRFPNRWIGSLSSFRASSRDQNRLQNSLNGVESCRQMYLEPNSSSEEPTSGCLLTNSKYLKPAQQLLYEVVNVGRGIQSNNANTLQGKMQSWMATGSMENESFAMEKAVLSESGRKDNIVLSSPQMATSTAAISTTAAISNAISAPQLNSENVSQLSMPERQEMQTKKAKLMAMLDEVNRRYKQYYKQMHTVVTSFEAAAGVGAAKTYTALALQTISRHFRCLRDAIRSQIEVSSKALGEEDLSGQGIGSSTLRFVDQQLHQFGMMQQHAWRPQRGLPERSVSVLRAWLFEHFLHPYPKDSDKVMLARRTGLSRSQVSNWFINARVRLWKPMVEEMYLEENRDVNMGACTNSQLGNASEEGRKEEEEGEEEEEEEETMAMKRKKSIGNSVDGIGNGGGSYNGQPGLNPDVGVSEQSNASEMMMMMTMMRRNNSNNNQNINSTPESQLIYEKEQMKKQSCLTRPENGIMLNDHNTGFSNLNMGIYEEDLRMKENTSNEIRGENKHAFSIPYQQQGGILQHADSLGGLDGSYINVGSLVGRYSQEGFHQYGGVSLTLGLQHCDNHQSYMANIAQVFPPPQHRRHELGSDDTTYYNTATPAG